MRLFLLIILIITTVVLCSCSHNPQIHLIEWYENGNPKKIVYDNFSSGTIFQIGGTNEVKLGNQKDINLNCE